jgi:hypothetical protein
MNSTQIIVIAVVGVVAVAINFGPGLWSWLTSKAKPADDHVDCDQLSKIALQLMECDEGEHSAECKTVGKAIWDE